MSDCAVSRSFSAATDTSARRRRDRRRGFSLVEIMISMAVLSMMIGGVFVALIQTQRLAESNLAQAYAEVTAQSIIEQLIAQPYTVLSDTTLTSVTIKLPSLNEDNETVMEDFELEWAANANDFEAIGTPDPDQGVLTDVAYIRESNTIRPERYLRMRVCLLRDTTANSINNRRVPLTLRYQWAAPDRRIGTEPVYLTGELRTVRSSASSF
jgi:prepilin-type N-terminal cleavage/methylation domain-containing protein